MMPIKPRLKFRGAVPYGGGYTLENSDKGFVGFGTTFDMLMTNVRNYRKANALPNGLGLEEEVECEVCRLYPAECIETDARVPVPRPISWQEAVQGTRVMMSHQLAGRPLVPREEAERRAKICADCPWNYQVNFQCSGICGELQQVVQAIVGSQGTPHDGKLRSCAVCHCYLTASVWVPIEIQTPHLTAEQRSQYKLAKEEWGCWKYTE